KTMTDGRSSHENVAALGTVTFEVFIGEWDYQWMMADGEKLDLPAREIVVTRAAGFAHDQLSRIAPTDQLESARALIGGMLHALARMLNRHIDDLPIGFGN